MPTLSRLAFRSSIVLFALCASLSVSCGGRKAVPRAPVSGKVTVGEKAVTGGIITFVWADNPRDSATVYIRSDGTYESRSAPVGNCKISVRIKHLHHHQNQAK
jgi:hypothetical protein